MELLEIFLNDQWEDLNKKMADSLEEDPTRILELKKAKQFIKMKARGQMLISPQPSKNWRKDIRKEISLKLKNLTSEEILQGATFLDKPFQEKKKKERMKSSKLEPKQFRNTQQYGFHSKSMNQGNQHYHNSSVDMVLPGRHQDMNESLDQVTEIENGRDQKRCNLESVIKLTCDVEFKSEQAVESIMDDKSAVFNNTNRDKVMSKTFFGPPTSQQIELSPTPKTMAVKSPFALNSDKQEDNHAVEEDNAPSENSQDLKDFERKVQNEIAYKQIQLYNKRCDKAISKQVFLKDGGNKKIDMMKNLRKKFNINDRMMSPFTKMPLNTGLKLEDILNHEKKKKDALMSKVISIAKE